MTADIIQFPAGVERDDRWWETVIRTIAAHGVPKEIVNAGVQSAREWFEQNSKSQFSFALRADMTDDERAAEIQRMVNAATLPLMERITMLEVLLAHARAENESH